MFSLWFLRPWGKLHGILLVISAGVVLWFASDVHFRVFQPREIQQRLFGAKLAGPFALRHASYNCCAMDGSGILSWTYEIAPSLAAELSKRCRFANGQPKPFVDVGTPYYDVHGHQCIVARVYDEEHDSDLSAEISGDRLEVRLFYLDT